MSGESCQMPFLFQSANTVDYSDWFSDAKATWNVWVVWFVVGYSFHRFGFALLGLTALILFSIFCILFKIYFYYFCSCLCVSVRGGQTGSLVTYGQSLAGSKSSPCSSLSPLQPPLSHFNIWFLCQFAFGI